MNTNEKHEELVDRILTTESNGLVKDKPEYDIDAELKEIIDDYLAETNENNGTSDDQFSVNCGCNHDCANCHADENEHECSGDCSECHCEHDCHDCSEPSDDNDSVVGEQSLDLHLLNGEIYSVDVASITTDEFIANVGSLDENIKSIRSMLQNILATPVDREDHDAFVEHVISQIDDFTVGIGIRLGYGMFNQKLPRREIAMLMCCDSINIISTISYWVNSYIQINTLAEAFTTPFDIEKEYNEDENC